MLSAFDGNKDGMDIFVFEGTLLHATDSQ